MIVDRIAKKEAPSSKIIPNKTCSWEGKYITHIDDLLNRDDLSEIIYLAVMLKGAK